MEDIRQGAGQIEKHLRCQTERFFQEHPQSVRNQPHNIYKHNTNGWRYALAGVEAFMASHQKYWEAQKKMESIESTPSQTASKSKSQMHSNAAMCVQYKKCVHLAGMEGGGWVVTSIHPPANM